MRFSIRGIPAWLCVGTGRDGVAHLFAKTTWDSSGGRKTRGQTSGPVPHKSDAVATARMIIEVQATTTCMGDRLPLLHGIRQVQYDAAAREGT